MSSHQDKPFAAIVLAAGHARRFGGDKLGAPFRGSPLLAHALGAARAAPVDRVILVCREPLPLPNDGPPPLSQVPLASGGLAQSLSAGLTAAGDVAGAFVFLGDMPLVPHGLAAQLAAALDNGFASLPRCHGHPGHPVLLARRAFAEVMALSGDDGAGRLLRARGDVRWIETQDTGVLLDVDHADDLERLERPRAVEG